MDSHNNFLAHIYAKVQTRTHSFSHIQYSCLEQQGGDKFVFPAGSVISGPERGVGKAEAQCKELSECVTLMVPTLMEPEGSVRMGCQRPLLEAC